MAKVLSLTTTVAALEAASEFAGPVDYLAINQKQEWLVKRYGAYKNALRSIPELEAWAKLTAEELNEILEKRGFSIRLDPWIPNPDAFGTLGILDYTLTWFEPGLPTKICDEKYEAFTLNELSIVKSSEILGNQNPLVELRTQTDDIVKIIKSDEPKDEFEVTEIIETIRNAEHTPSKNFTKVKIPKVHYSQETDMDWLCGFSSGSTSVVAALQEVRFGMNEIGARAKEATALSMIRGLPPKPVEYVFDEPFLIWVERPGVNVPIFQAWIGEDDWKDPGDLLNL